MFAQGRPSRDVLIRQLQESLLELRDSSARISTVDWQRSKYSSSYETYVVNVRLSDGQKRRIFLKDFGSASQEKADMTLRRQRELEVYRDFLSDAHLATAEYYGSAWDETEHRYWLLLEFVSGTPARYCDFKYWVSAAAWLGRLHASFLMAAVTIHESLYLQRYDAAFFEAKAERALKVVSQTSRTLAENLREVVDNYGTPAPA